MLAETRRSLQNRGKGGCGPSQAPGKTVDISSVPTQEACQRTKRVWVDLTRHGGTYPSAREDEAEGLQVLSSQPSWAWYSLHTWEVGLSLGNIVDPVSKKLSESQDGLSCPVGCSHECRPGSPEVLGCSIHSVCRMLYLRRRQGGREGACLCSSPALGRLSPDYRFKGQTAGLHSEF